MSKRSILIIDESKPLSDNLRDAFEKRGFIATQVFSVAAAKETLLENSFDYALLDPVLPDGQGEELLPFLQIHENIRVIVVTSDRDRERRENLFSFGVVIDYITKERNFDDMVMAIVELIERISSNGDLTILIVDDSIFMRTHLRILLSTRGFKVLDAIDGKQALEVIATNKVDAAIIDLEMPVMDGNELLYNVRKDKANLLMPVMVVSGTIDTEMIARVIKNGAYDFIRKPYSTEELLLKVDKMIQDIKQQRMIKIHEARFAMYNRAIDQAAIYFRLDKNLKFLYANHALNTLITNEKELEKELVFDSFIKPNQGDKLSDLKTAILEGKIFHKTFRLKSDKFHDLHLRLSFTPLQNENKDVEEIIVIGFDVSLLQKNETILNDRINVGLKKNWEQSKLLIQQSKMASMGEMIGHIGHQWRQPLNALGLMFQKLDKAYHKQLLTDQLMDQSTQKAMTIINQMSKTIDDFRDFFKIDKKIQICMLVDVLYQTLDVIGPTLQNKHINLKINSNGARLVPCFKNELSQVILNLIVNAMDALVENSVEHGEITITIEDGQEEAYMSIEDNAGGIPEDIIEKIFDPYFTTKGNSNGTGIGLYMSKAIIEEHMSGKLEVRNTLFGASFKITLPTDVSHS